MSYFDELVFLGAGIDENVVTPFTSTPNSCSLNFIKEGRVILCKHGEHEAQELEPPVVFWFHPQSRYECRPAPENGCYRYWVDFDGPRAIRLLSGGLAPLSSVGWMGVRQIGLFAETFRQLVELVQRGNAFCHPEDVMALESLVVMLWKEGHSGEPTGRRREIERLVYEIHSNPYAPINFRDVARQLHLSYRHLCRLFREHVGHTPYDYLLLCRMRKAATELLRSERPIKAIARDAGYDDPAQFSKVFKKKIGFSPQEFRSYGATS